MNSMMSAQETIKSFVMDGLHWLTQNAYIKSMAWLGFEFFVLLAIVCSLFHPILRGILRYVYLDDIVCILSSLFL